MTIGELLKKYRLNIGLTLDEMSAGIVSTSFYSKVEKGQHRISAEDLFDLLKAHSINLGTFLNELSQEENIINQYQQKIFTLYYEEDKEALKDILVRLEDKNTENAQMFIALVESCLHDLDDTFIISAKSIEIIKEKIFSLPNWNYFKLSLYTNFISLYEIETNQLIIRSILSKEMAKYKKEEQSAIIAILLNFADDLIEKDKLEHASYYLQKAEEFLTPIPELLFYQVALNFNKNIINYRTSNDYKYIDKCKKTIEFFRANGYGTYADSLGEYVSRITIRK